jgi:hypothetical protein
MERAASDVAVAVDDILLMKVSSHTFESDLLVGGWMVQGTASEMLRGIDASWWSGDSLSRLAALHMYYHTLLLNTIDLRSGFVLCSVLNRGRANGSSSPSSSPSSSLFFG